MRKIIKSLKIRLKPTKEQEKLMFQSVSASRYAYNWALKKTKELYEQGINFNVFLLKKEFNKHKKDYSWLLEVSQASLVQSLRDLERGMQLFFDKKRKFPTGAGKYRKQSFYVRYDNLYFKNGRANLEKIGKVKYSTNFKIPSLKKFKNPRCTHDGKYWYLTFGYECKEENLLLTDESVGIDLGVRILAYASNQEKPIENINKTPKIKKLKKKLKRKQRQVSRKYEMNKTEEGFVKTSNIRKKEKEIKLIYRKLTNIRKNHMYHAILSIIKTRPKRIVMENLDVADMMKDKSQREYVQEQLFYEFRRQMEYKCNKHGIDFVLADRFYPSTKLCSCCGHKKKFIRRDETIYTCEECGFVIDRDLNAAFNLAKY